MAMFGSNRDSEGIERWQQVLNDHMGVEVSSGTYDFSNMEGLREDVMAAMKEHGIDPAQPGAVDASQVQGLQEAIGKAFQTHGIDLAALQGMAQSAMAAGFAGMQAAPAAAALSADDVKARLAKIENLRATGAISQAEQEKLRKQVLDEL